MQVVQCLTTFSLFMYKKDLEKKTHYKVIPFTKLTLLKYISCTNSQN